MGNPIKPLCHAAIEVYTDSDFSDNPNLWLMVSEEDFDKCVLDTKLKFGNLDIYSLSPAALFDVLTETAEQRAYDQGYLLDKVKITFL